MRYFMESLIRLGFQGMEHIGAFIVEEKKKDKSQLRATLVVGLGSGCTSLLPASELPLDFTASEVDSN